MLQADGLATSAPTPAVLAEAYIQNRERKQIYPVLIYRIFQANIDENLAKFNEKPTMKFIIRVEKKLQYSTNFIDLSIHCRKEEI
jgi:hypothetical protein